MGEQAEAEGLTEEHLAALVRFARSIAAALHAAVQFAGRSEQVLADTITALRDAGLTEDDIAYRAGLSKEHVHQALAGDGLGSTRVGWTRRDRGWPGRY